MGQVNRVCYTLLVSIIVGALCLAAAPASSSQRISAGESVTLLAAPFRLAVGEEAVSALEATARTPNEAEVQLMTFGDLLAALLNAGSTRVTGADSRPALETRPQQYPIQECQRLPKIRDCLRCCLNLGLANNQCGRACLSIPRPSGPEPTP